MDNSTLEIVYQEIDKLIKDIRRDEADGRPEMPSSAAELTALKLRIKNRCQ